MEMLIFSSDRQGDTFYSMMGQYFASLQIAKELERQVYNKPNTDWFVYSDLGIVFGFASVHHERNNLFIDNLYVLPEHRHEGVATEIIRNIILEYSDGPLPLKCIAINPYAMAIFKKFGFEEVGKIGKYTRLEKH